MRKCYHNNIQSSIDNNALQTFDLIAAVYKEYSKELIWVLASASIILNTWDFKKIKIVSNFYYL